MVLISELSLVVYVHVSKWVTILMLRICYGDDAPQNYSNLRLFRK